MDTSEAYIKMCDCSEIQEQWNLGIYDFAKKREWPRTFVPSTKIRNKAWYIWLPRQDQIQEMLDYGLGAFVNDFKEFCEDNLKMYSTVDPPFWGYHSMEQLWLLFYMHEKHSKIWIGEKWIKK